MIEETNDPQNEEEQQPQSGEAEGEEREPSRADDDLQNDPAYNPDDEDLKGLKGG